MICANIDTSIQAHIPRHRSSQSFLTQMKCQVTLDTSHDVLISKEIGFTSYKEICIGQKKKVNLGFLGNWFGFEVENNTLVHTPARILEDYIHGRYSNMPHEWEVLSKFFSIHNIETNWLDCDWTYGYYDDELGGWTGCVGKVRGIEYWM